jgi:hypothetical protein
MDGTLLILFKNLLARTLVSADTRYNEEVNALSTSVTDTIR